MHNFTDQKRANSFYLLLKRFTSDETVVYNYRLWHISNPGDREYFLTIANTYVRQHETGLKCLLLEVQIDIVKDCINKIRAFKNV